MDWNKLLLFFLLTSACVTQGEDLSASEASNEATYGQIFSGSGDVDGCNTTFCGNNAHCENSSSSFECVCNDGWEGDGFICTVKETTYPVEVTTTSAATTNTTSATTIPTNSAATTNITSAATTTTTGAAATNTTSAATTTTTGAATTNNTSAATTTTTSATTIPTNSAATTNITSAATTTTTGAAATNTTSAATTTTTGAATTNNTSAATTTTTGAVTTNTTSAATTTTTSAATSNTTSAAITTTTGATTTNTTSAETTTATSAATTNTSSAATTTTNTTSAATINTTSAATTTTTSAATTTTTSAATTTTTNHPAEPTTSGTCPETCDGCSSCEIIDGRCNCTCVNGYYHVGGIICKPVECNETSVPFRYDQSIWVSFPTTQAGYSAQSETVCDDETPNARTPYGKRFCILNGTWGNVTWLSSCDTTLQDLETTTIETPEERQKAASNLEILTSQPETLNAEDVSSTVLVLESVVNTPDLEKETASSVVQTVGNLLNVPEQKLQESGETSNILQTLDAVGENVDLDDGGTFAEVTPSLGVAVAQLKSKDAQSGIGYKFNALSTPSDLGFREDQLNIFESVPPEEQFTSYVYVPEEAITKSSENRISFYAFLDDSLFNSSTQQSQNESVNSEIIFTATVVGEDDVKDLTIPVELHFSLKQKSDIGMEGVNTECVFWNEETQMWINEGGKTSVSSTDVHCSFNHLTNFATLFSPSEAVNTSALNWITLIGSSISIACLILTLIVFAFVRSTSTGTRFRSSFLLVNLCLALLCLNVLLILSQQGFVISSEDGCIAVAVLLHFFFLSAMAWMTIEALNIYMAIVHVIYTRANVTNRMVVTISTLWGWLMPAVFVSIVVGIDVDNYVRGDEQCWISLDLIEYLIVIPCSIMLGFNLIVYVIASYKVTCGRIAINKSSTRMSDVKRNVMFSWILFLTVGGTWIFGFAVFASDSYTSLQLAFSYIFAVLNSLQGCFLFLMYVVRQGLLRTFGEKVTSMTSKNKSDEIGASSRTTNLPLVKLHTNSRTSIQSIPKSVDDSEISNKDVSKNLQSLFQSIEPQTDETHQDEEENHYSHLSQDTSQRDVYESLYNNLRNPSYQFQIRRPSVLNSTNDLSGSVEEFTTKSLTSIQEEFPIESD